MQVDPSDEEGTNNSGYIQYLASYPCTRRINKQLLAPRNFSEFEAIY